MTAGRDWQLFHVDTTEITHLSLCSGYGGIDLGLKRVIPNLRTVAYAEIEAFACENILARMEGGQLDAAPIWSDLKSFPWEQFSGLVDVLSGGYPCQPFSSAGKRAGADDPRHLWPFISAGIAIMRPSLCFFENVEGHISLGLPDVIEDLGRLGYRTTWGIFSAAEAGAPHQRKRVFIMAHRIDQGPQRWLQRWQDSEGQSQHGHTGCSSAGTQDWWPSRPGEPQHAWEPPRVAGNASLLDGSGQAGGQREAQVGRTSAEWDNGQVKSPLGGDIDGTPSGMGYAELCVTCDNRTDELRLLGNGVVPATAALAFQTLLNELSTR